MNIKSPAIKLLSFILVALSSCNQKINDAELKSMNEGELTNHNFYFSIPYVESGNGAALIDVEIGGKTRKFMVDTGAPLSLSTDLASELKIPALQDIYLRDANGDSTHVVIVRSPKLMIGELSFDNVPALVLDLKNPLFACDRFDGIIGSNLLRLLIIQFNSSNKTISLGDDISTFQFVGDELKQEMKLSENQSDPLLAVKISSIITDTVLFDTGDRHLYNISHLMMDGFKNDFEKMIINRGTGSISQGIVGNANNDALSRQARVDSMTFGNSVIRDVITLEQTSDRSRVGRALWQYGVVTVDYRNSNFYFSQFNDGKIFNHQPDFGFTFQERLGKMVATVVWQGSEAEQCGLKPGVELTAIGGFMPSDVAQCEWESSALRELNSSTLTVKYIDESGNARQCSLKKIDHED